MAPWPPGTTAAAMARRLSSTLRKIFDRVEFVEKNTSIYFDPQNPLARARNANISQAILASESIVAEDADGVLVAATNLFLRETLTMVKFGRR
jgi:hypothetical protein